MMFVDDKRDVLGELRAQKFDLALLLQNAFQAAWIAWRAGIPERIGYARDGRSPLLTKALPVPKLGEIPVHEQFYYLELLRRAGWLDTLPNESFIKLNVSEENRRHAEEFLISVGARPDSLRIAIGAGASYGSAKCWPPDRFAELANRLTVGVRCRRNSIRYVLRSARFVSDCSGHAPLAHRSHRKNAHS